MYLSTKYSCPALLSIRQSRRQRPQTHQISKNIGLNSDPNDNITAEMFNAYFASVFTKEREVAPEAEADNMCSNNQEVF